MISVCHIISGDLWAGAEVMVFNLLKCFGSHEGLHPMAIVLNNAELSRRIKALGINTHILDERKQSFGSILKGIKQILKKHPVDVIHTHRYKENLLGYLASRDVSNTKLVATQHGFPETREGNISLKDIAIRRLNFFLLSRRFHYVVAVSEDLAEKLTNIYKIRKKNLKVIHNGILLSDDTVKKRRNAYVVIGSAGRFFQVKDYPLMIEVAHQVTGYTDKIIFKLAGEGPELETLRALVLKYNISERFEFSGFVDDMPSFYKGLDLYINTSFHEGIPMSVLEAMAHELPVIAPRVGGFGEMITDGADGYLIEGRNPASFAEKCLLLAEDDALRKKMSQYARQKIENCFSAEEMSNRYHELYRSLMS